ncbi:MAG: type II secretion system F family protein [Cyanobacteria bacterium Co-bin13]|nr:type II secretion system F family protein [Cyanobacteria bacterium Co-bin13]
MNKARFFHQFAALLKAGFPTGKSLAMAGQATSAEIFLAQSSQRVEAGEPVAATLRGRQSPFTPWEIALLQIGEASGTLAEVSLRLAQQTEVHQRRAKLYGSVTVALGMGVMALLLGLAALLGIDWILHPAFLLPLAGVLALGLIGKDFVQLEALEYSQLWYMPGFKGVSEARSQIYLAELALPLHCGLPMDQALELLRPRLPDPLLAAAIGTAAQQVRQGRSLSQSLQRKVPPTTLQMIRTGEETGTLDTLLDKLGKYYEGELEQRLKRIEGILRPLSLVSMGAILLMLGLQTLGGLVPGS